MTPAELYAEYIRESRARQISINNATVKDIDRLLGNVLNSVRQDIVTVPRGILGDRFRRQLDANLDRTLTTFRKEYKTTLDDKIKQSAGNVAVREYRLLSALVADRHAGHPEKALTLATTAANHTSALGVEFGRVPALVLDRLYARVYPDGLKLSDRLHNLDDNARASIRNIVYEGVAKGKSARVIAKQLEPVLRQGGTENVRYNALRIARTEVGVAYREGHIASTLDAQGNLQPWIQAIGWRLSPAHPRTDICDAWAGDDVYGLGPGNYDPGDVPPGHPHCLCTTVSILASNPKPQFIAKLPRPSEVSDAQRRYYNFGAGLQSPPRGNPAASARAVAQSSTRKRQTANAASTANQQKLRPGTQRSMITARERQIQPQHFETAYAVDQYANVVIDKNGAQYSVSFSNSEMATMKASKGLIITHNHPRGWGYPSTDPQHVGNSFSDSDIRLASNVEAAEMRAITPTHRYSMKPPPGGWNANLWQTVIQPEFDKANKQVEARNIALINAGKLTIDQAEAQHWHEVWSIVSTNIGMPYKREKVK